MSSFESFMLRQILRPEPSQSDFYGLDLNLSDGVARLTTPLY